MSIARRHRDRPDKAIVDIGFYGGSLAEQHVQAATHQIDHCRAYALIGNSPSSDALAQIGVAISGELGSSLR